MTPPGWISREILSASILILLAMAAPGLAADDTGIADEFPRMSLDQDPKPPAPATKEDEPKLPWRTFELMLGGTYSSVTSTVVLSRTDKSGALSIDGEGVLGLSREELSPYVWTAYRLGERHRLSFSFEDATRTSTRTLQRDITIDGTTYPAGTSIHTEMGLQLYTLTYVWSFLQDERMELGLTIAFNVMRTHLEIDVSSPQSTNNNRVDFPIPLPGLDADFVLIKNLWLRERLELMYVPVQSYSGLFVNANVALEWSFIKNLSVGLGFDMKRIEFTSSENSTTLGSFDGKFKYNAAGVLFYINFHM